MSITTYVRRLQITFNTAEYVGSLGLGHRIGWLEIGGMIAVTVLLLIHIQDIVWEFNVLPRQMERKKIQRNTLVTNFLEIAAAGLLQYLLLTLINRFTILHPFLYFFARMQRF